jgi:hypothetical protein
MRITALIASVTFVTGLLTGWKVNGWRLEARIADLQASYALTYAEAEKAARNRETELNQDLIEIRRLRDAEVTNISNRLASALNSLRDRPERPAGGLPKDSTARGGCTANELFREDAESFIWIARDADTVRASLETCVRAYDSARKALE